MNVNNVASLLLVGNHIIHVVIAQHSVKSVDGRRVICIVLSYSPFNSRLCELATSGKDL